MANPVQSGISLADFITTNTIPKMQQTYGEIAISAQKEGASAAELASERELATANALRKVNDFANSIGFDQLNAATAQDYLATQDEARAYHQQAAAELADLSAKSKVGFFDSPVTWLGNQLSFDSDYKATQATVASASEKTNEALALKDKILTLNSIVQDTRKTEMDIAQTSTAKTAQLLSDIETRKAEQLALKAQVEGIATGTTMRVQAQNTLLQAEELRMSQERLALEKQRIEEAAKDKAKEQSVLDTYYGYAIKGIAKVNNLSLEEAVKRIGKKPASVAEIKLLQDSSPIYRAAVEVGMNESLGNRNVYGSNLASALDNVESLGGTKGNPHNADLMQAVQTVYQRAAAGETNPKLKADVGAKAVANFLETSGKIPAGRDVVPYLKGNPLAYAAPAMLLTEGFVTTGKDKERIAALKQSPLIQAASAAGTLNSTNPEEVIKFAAAWGAQNKQSPTETATALAALYSGLKAHRQATLAEIGASVGAVDKLKYSSSIGTMWGTADFDPTSKADMQKLVVHAQYEAWKEGKAPLLTK